MITNMTSKKRRGFLLFSNPRKPYVYEYDRFKTQRLRTSIKCRLGTISGTVALYDKKIKIQYYTFLSEIKKFFLPIELYIDSRNIQLWGYFQIMDWDG